MSRKLTVLVVGVVGLFALAVGTMQGCGSSSGGSSNADLCKKICEKNTMCTPDAGATDTMQCETLCNSQSANVHCSNQAAIASAINTCVGMDCTAALDCLNNGSVPDCQQTTGGGGNGGTSGGGGAGGSSGSAWSCQDDPANGGCGCAMAAGAGNLTSCPTTYNCCFTLPAQGTAPQTCLCSTATTTADCTTAAGALGGTKVTRCPP